MNEQRVAVLTGGASGIGQMLSVRLARAGYAVVAGYYPNDPHDPTETTALVERDGGTVTMVPIDVSRTEDCERLVQVAVEQHGRVDAVIANAAILRRSRFVELTDAEWDQLLGVDLGGVMRTFRAAVPHLGSGASLVAISSMTGGIYGFAERAHYATAKAGVLGLVRTLAAELGPEGIRTNAVLPGVIDTPQSRDAANSIGPEAIERVRRGIPLGRSGAADEIAAVVEFLLSPGASYVNGASIVVDGGLSIRQPTD